MADKQTSSSVSKKAKGSVALVGVVCAFLAGSSYGVGGALSQVVVRQGYTIAQMSLLQFLIAAIITGILVLVKYRPTMSVRDMIKLGFIGIASAVSTIFYYLAIDTLSVAAGVAIQFQYVWMAVLIQCIIDKILPKKWTVISAVLIMFGTVLGSGMADEILAGGLQMDPLGLVYALLCALLYAVFIVANGYVAVEHHPITRTFFLEIGALASAIVMLFVSGDAGKSFDVVGLLPGATLMAVVMSVLPALFIVIASSKISGGLCAILTSSELPVAVLSGWLLLGESASVLIIVGVVIILIAIAMAEFLTGDKEPDEANPQQT